MKQLGLILLIAGLALISVGLLHQFMPSPAAPIGASLHNSYYVVTTIHMSVMGGLPLALLGMLLFWRGKSAIAPRAAAGTGLLLAGALCIVGELARHAIIKAAFRRMFAIEKLDGAHYIVTTLPLEMAFGAILGITGFMILSWSRPADRPGAPPSS